MSSVLAQGARHKLIVEQKLFAGLLLLLLRGCTIGKRSLLRDSEDARVRRRDNSTARIEIRAGSVGWCSKTIKCGDQSKRAWVKCEELQNVARSSRKLGNELESGSLLGSKLAVMQRVWTTSGQLGSCINMGKEV